jgi:hypothetical protein
VRPVLVESFLRQRLNRRQDAPAFARARRLVDYYDLRSVSDHFRNFLDRKETSAVEFEQSCHCVTVLADAAEPNLNQEANHYFDYLVKHRLAVERYDAVLEVLETLEAKADPQPLADRWAREMKELEVRAKTDLEADNQYQRLDQYLNNELPRVLETNQLRYRILALPDPAQRIDELVRYYLGWERDSTTEMYWWSARWLRREYQSPNAELVLQTLRQRIAEIEAAKIPAAERVFPKVRTLHALQFLGVELTPGEQRYLARPDAKQIDILYREP